MGTLLGWFRGRREAKIISRIQEHSKVAYNCVVQYKDALTLFLNGDMKGSQASIQKVNKIENQCDKLRREVMNSLTQGELTPQLRNDLAHLINRLDNVANSANAAARHLAILQKDAIQEISDILLEMVDKSILCAEILRDTIEIEIKGTIKEVDKSIAKIHKLEHEVDQIHYKILGRLNNLEYKNISPFIALNLYELIGNTENISDWCESTADFVKIINLRTASKSS